MWWDWLSTAERVLHALYEQNTALELRDVDRVKKIQPELENLLAKMKDVDYKAANIAKNLAEEYGAEKSFKGLLSVLEKEEAARIETISTRVRTVALNVKTQLAKNRALIENEISYISGTLSTIAKLSADHQGPYNKNQYGAVILDQVT